jgi:hypothetical protein
MFSSLFYIKITIRAVVYLQFLILHPLNLNNFDRQEKHVAHQYFYVMICFLGKECTD